ncbi:MAG: GatB/YqeY domain-containing protein [Candidatus Moranbacteria bacterium]|nr:GatB/YqeY domain-containing protein [Candidatus Moranbacteria bacterium]
MKNLIKKIDQKFVAAMKNKDQVVLSTLRMIKSAIKEKEIEKKEPLNDREVVSILKNQLKRRQDSIKQYQNAGRDDLKEKEEQEAKIIKEFLPEELSDEKLEKIVKQAIKETKAKEKKDIGKVMPVAIKETQGIASGERIKDLVLKNLE